MICHLLLSWRIAVRLGLLMLVCLCGCGGTTAPKKSAESVPAVSAAPAVVASAPQVAEPSPAIAVEKPTATAPAAVPEKPKESKKVTVFKEKVTNYLAEARAGAKLIELAPSVNDMRAKSKEITDLLTHLPDVPTEIEDAEHISTRLKNINGSFFVAVQYAGLSVDAVKLKSPELIKSTGENFLKTAKTIREAADEIEKKLGLTD
jgi:hypothetical protein